MHPAPCDHIESIAALRHDLNTVGYTADHVAELLGETAAAALNRDQHVPARRALAQPLAQGDPLAGLISCFMLADPISPSMAERIFATLGLDAALALNIVTRDTNDDVVATVDRVGLWHRPPGDLWVASDQTALQLGTALPAEHILGVGKASLTLAEITPRHQVDTALDIGTGCGIQALHLLSHAKHDTMTEVSQRALNFARFNILLNAPALDVDPNNMADRVTVDAGNMLEPVAEHTFDLVVTNTPFVIAPTAIHRDPCLSRTGRTGDELVQELISIIDTVLADGDRL